MKEGTLLELKIRNSRGLIFMKTYFIELPVHDFKECKIGVVYPGAPFFGSKAWIYFLKLKFKSERYITVCIHYF